MENAPMALVQPHWLRFDTSGVIIDGVIPVHPDALLDSLVNSEQHLRLGMVGEVARRRPTTGQCSSTQTPPPPAGEVPVKGSY